MRSEPLVRRTRYDVDPKVAHVERQVRHRVDGVNVDARSHTLSRGDDRLEIWHESERVGRRADGNPTRAWINGSRDAAWIQFQRRLGEFDEPEVSSGCTRCQL